MNRSSPQDGARGCGCYSPGLSGERPTPPSSPGFDKVFFDATLYGAEALLGEAAEKMVAATEQAGWRTYSSVYLLDELEGILAKLGFSHRLAFWPRQRLLR